MAFTWRDADSFSGRQDQAIDRGRETERFVESPRVAIEGVDRDLDMRRALAARPVDDGAEQPPTHPPIALIGAHHEIVNLTRLEAAPGATYEVVGPICESADVLGHERILPLSREGDVILIATAGAYGHAMSSRYNLREPAEELLL